MEKEKAQSWNSIFGSFLNPNCESSMDLFESALSSIVSSRVGIPIPGGGGGASDSIVLRELIGRLGAICNSGEISPFNGNTSATNSCYNTPLNSPPKLNLSIPIPVSGNHQLPFPARFSPFGVRIPDENKKISSDSISMEEPSVSETGTGTGMKGQSTNNSNGRKRKGKGKETQTQTQTQSSSTTTTISAKDDKVVAETAEKEESDAKRSKSNEVKKSTEPPKDYIHVRARRGQATDSHSLAERVRREKISERMKFLQDLVPGCNRVTGKAVMLDEIINYVQSLQRQVEFLSMKLATVNPRMDVSMEALLSKDMFRPLVSVPNNVNPFDASVQPFPYGFQSQINGMVPDGPEHQFSMNPLMAAMHCNSIMKPSHIDGFGEASAFWENDLQSVVKMAIGQDQPQGFHGQMKVEL